MADTMVPRDHVLLPPPMQAKLEKPKRLREAAGRDWGEIEPGTLRCAAPLGAAWRWLRAL